VIRDLSQIEKLIQKTTVKEGVIAAKAAAAVKTAG
jgi:NADH/NAD ratio-sensing transcriptional regulator Rex